MSNILKLSDNILYGVPDFPNRDNGFTCDDCKEFYHTKIGSFKLVNKIVKGDDKIVCSKCIKLYNIRKPS